MINYLLRGLHCDEIDGRRQEHAGALAQWLYSSRDDRAGSSILEAPAYTIDVYA